MKPETRSKTHPIRYPDHHEVIDGWIVEKARLYVHEVVMGSNIVRSMGQHVHENRLGQMVSNMLFALDPTRDLQRRPDIAFVSYERWPEHRAIPPGEAWEVIPDLAIEIVGRTNLVVDLMARLDEYFAAGVRIVWVVHPNQSRIFTFDSPTSIQILQWGDDLDGQAVLPGFRLPLAKVFNV